jgi:bacteriocin biosynthesis cyclodehydratase domain-containing protein
MAPRIDPNLPLVWRSPTDLQLGATQARVIIPDAGELESSLIAALRHGASATTLMTIGTGLGASADEVRRLLTALEPAFEPDQGRAGAASAAMTVDQPVRVVLDAAGLVERHLARSLEALGYDVVAGHDEAADHVALAVISAQWVVAPARHLPFLRRDVPHLAIVFDDTGARVGPLVEPGAGPCLRCLDLARRDEDPAWPVIAAQLAGRPAATCTPRAALDASALAAAVVDDRLAHGLSPLADGSLTLERPGALPRRRRHEPHPECGCRTPVGSATAPVRLGTRRQSAPSSTRAGAVLA